MKKTTDLPTQDDDFIVNLVSQGFLKVSGNDAKKLLQGQLTCDLEKITSTHSSLGAHCNPKGRIISFFRIFMIGSDYYLQMPKNLLPLALAALQKYAVFYKVTLTDASTSLQKIGFKSAQFEKNSPLFHDLLLIEVSENRYEIIGQPTSIEKVWETLEESLEIVSEDIWKYFDICSKIPAIYPETSEKFLPHDLQLPLLNAVSFEKGCFTGQEIVARMQYLGKLKNHLHQTRITLDSPPTLNGSFQTESGSHGNIVDYCRIDYNVFEILFIAPEQ